MNTPLFAVLVFLLCLSGLAGAQETTPEVDVPWPPDPQVVFAPGVEILSEELSAATQPVYPFVAHDDKERVIRVPLEGETRAYPYPETFARVFTIIQPEESDTLIVVAGEGDQDTYYPPVAVYTLDVATGEFALYEPCRGTIVRGAGERLSFWKRGWTFVLNPVTGLTHLCNQDTGELSDPLPVGSIGGPFGWSGIAAAPSGDWLLLIAGVETAGSFSFYGYELATGRVNDLGYIGGQSFLGGGVGWLSDTQYLFEITASIDGLDGLYRMDVTVSDSLVRLASGSWVFLEEIGQYEQFYNSGRCRIIFLDPMTAESTFSELGARCAGVFRVADGRYLAVVHDAGASPPARLVTLDVAQGMSDLFSGEIELLYGASPDGRYAVLITDDSGEIDYSPDENFSWDQTANPTVTFFDAARGEVRYTLPYGGWKAPYWWRADSEIVGVTQGHRMTEGVTWLDENTALVQRAPGSDSEHLVLNFADDGGIEEFPVSDVFDVFAGPGQLVLQRGDSYDATTYRVHDLATGATLPLFAPDFPTDQYIVNVFGSQQFTVQIAPISELGEGWEIYVTYEVRFSFDDAG